MQRKVLFEQKVPKYQDLVNALFDLVSSEGTVAHICQCDNTHKRNGTVCTIHFAKKVYRAATGIEQCVVLLDGGSEKRDDGLRYESCKIMNVSHLREQWHEGDEDLTDEERDELQHNDPLDVTYATTWEEAIRQAEAICKRYCWIIITS